MYAFPCPKEDIHLEHYEGYNIVQLGRDRVPEFTRFAFEVFKDRIGKRQGWQASEEDFQQMLDEEMSYVDRGLFLALCDENTGRIAGGYRLAQWRSNHVFPIEKVFNVSVTRLARQMDQSPYRFWHGSQLAFDKRAIKIAGSSALSLAYRMLCHAVHSMEILGGLYTLGESDPAVTRALARYGVRCQQISEEMEYIGKTHAVLIDNREAFASELFRDFAIAA